MRSTQRLVVRGGSMAALVVLLATWGVGNASDASAHPLGNFTVNTYNGLRIEPDAVAVEMVVDYAEVPTVQRFGPGGADTGPERRHYAVSECRQMAGQARLRVGGVRTPLHVTTSSLVQKPGDAGLRTARLTCRTRTDVDATGHRIEFADGADLDQVGWHEVTATGDGVRIRNSNVSDHSISARLTAYPETLLSSPLDQHEAALTVVDGVAVQDRPTAERDLTRQTSPTRPAADRLTAAFTDLVGSRELSPGFGVLALAIAVGLGLLHALAPGHGKTLMAAYLLGQDCTLRHVTVLGVTVTVTHTLGVLALGVLLTVTALAAPAQMYAWLGAVSGVLVVTIGMVLLRRALRRRARPHSDGHAHRHGHSDASLPTSTRGLVAVGFAGGMVPSPSALIVLLGGIALGRPWFGVLLVLAYGIGMTVALTGTGFALARGRDLVARWSTHGHATPGRSRVARAVAALPVATAVLVIIVGLGVSARALALL